MAFEEMSGPRASMSPKQVFASFDARSSPAGMTNHRPSASLLKDTPPSIIVALAQLAPIITVLNEILALITWTGSDNWSSFLLLSTFWLSCLYGDIVFHYGANWVLLGLLGIGYLRRKTKTRTIVRAIEKGDDPITTGTEDTQKVMDATLYEIDCLRARCHLLSSTLQPLYDLLTWEDPKRSALIGLRLILVTPLYIVVAWLFTPRSLILILGTFCLTFTSPWFKVTCTVCWRLRIVRKIASALLGVEYLPGEHNIMEAFSTTPIVKAFETTKEDITKDLLAGGSKFTTTISVIENQRRWLGLGWTPSLLPHERAPFTDADDRPGVAPENTALPVAKTVVVNGMTRTITWRWIDSDWRIEKDRGRDLEGWLYFDNAWRYPAASEEFGKYTRRRKWIRNAECSEVVGDSKDSLERTTPVENHSGRLSGPDSEKQRLTSTEGTKKSTQPRTLDPEKVKSSLALDSQPMPTLVGNMANHHATTTSLGTSPVREWREVNGGKELVPVEAVLKKRPFTLSRKDSRASTKSLGVD